MGYIGAGISRFNTADELTVTGDATIDTTTLVVDSTNNNVGIGTATPEDFGGGYTTLEVAGSSTANGGVFKTATSDSAGTGTAGTEMLMYSNNGGGVIAVTSSDPLLFQTAGAEVMRLTSAGLLGLGTSSPTQEIHGYSSGGDFSLKLESASATGTAYTMYKNADQEYAVGLRGSASDTFQIIDFTADATRLTVDTSGNVGIGTASPESSLQVTGAVNTTPDSSGVHLGMDSNYATIELAGSDGGQLDFPNAANTDYRGRIRYTASDNKMAFFAGGAGTQTMTVTNTSVGIGTSSPGVLLDVKSSGQAAFGIGSTNAGGAILYLDGDSNGDYSGTDYSFIRHDTNGRLDIVQNSPSGTNQLRFYTGNTERARFDSGSRFLVGQTSAAGIGAATDANSLELGPGYIVINRDDTATATQLAFGKNGSVVGSVSTTGSGTTYNTTSDIRLKQDIEPLEATDKLMAMNPVSYSWKADPDGPRSMGFIAQEMQEVMPEAVSTGDDDMMSMDYGRITPILVSALQDAHRKIDELAAEIAELKAS